MARARKQAAALGFAPHSGWAVLVALGGDPRGPALLLRERIEMSDSRLPGSRQPYHAVEGLGLGEAARRLTRYRESAAARANAGLEQVVERLSRGGYEPRRCGIVEGSGRRGVSLETTLASHALIHTADGNHFRDVLADAGARCGLEVCRVTERELLARAAAALRKGPEELQGRVLALGRSAGPPWAADQKKASLVAWLLLTEHDAGRGSG